MKNFSIEFLTSKTTKETGIESKNHKIYMNNSLDSSWESSSSTSSPASSPSSLSSSTNQRINTGIHMNGAPGMSRYLTDNFTQIPMKTEEPESIPIIRDLQIQEITKEETGNHEVQASQKIQETKENILKVKEPSKAKPPHSYIALISMAILDSSEKKLLLGDIYENIMTKFPYFNNQEKAWRNSIRHNLSLNECFIKSGRSDTGKGNYWSIHPACVDDFSKGDFRRRQARRRARRTLPQMPVSNPQMAYGTMGYVPMTSSTLPMNSAAPQHGTHIPQVPMAPSTLQQISSHLPQVTSGHLLSPTHQQPQVSVMSGHLLSPTNQQPQVSVTSGHLLSPTNQLPQVAVTSGHLLSPTNHLPLVSMTSGHLLSPTNQFPHVSMSSGHMFTATNPGAPYFSYANNLNCYVKQTPMVPNQYQNW